MDQFLGSRPRQLYDEKLVKCFVPNKVLDELDTNQNQLVFGRRGVGKTHTLKAYLGRKASVGELCHYLDCTAFGSGLGADGSSKNIGIRFFSKFLVRLADSLLEDAVLAEKPTSSLHDDLESILEQLASLASPRSLDGTFNYLNIIQLTNRFLDRFGAERLVVLIDEWAQIPKEAQPFFAEFLKRAIFANPKVTTKIGVVEYSYKLHDRVNDQVIGLERSADIFADVRMDRFFVWDEDNAFVETFFAEVLFNHLAIDMPVDITLDAERKHDAILNLFTQRHVLSELCRASEGNARDFLVLFGKAYAKFRQEGSREKIGLTDIYAASTDLYQGDKYSNISSEKPLEDFLDHLVHTIIKDKKSRTFMVPYQSYNHPLLSRLFSARILHPLSVEWSPHPHIPGERYRLITMDYGTYVSFKGTKSEPEQRVFWPCDDAEAGIREDLVPVDDRRSIRRIIVEKEVLDSFWDGKSAL